VGIREITWTFDPLQARNAHFNFAKLGALAGRYMVDFYGRESTSVLHQNGTDRLWVRWPLASQRVQQRLKRVPSLPEISPPVPPLVRFNGDGRPVRADLAAALARQRICIEIPGDIDAMEQADPALAWEWRLATRWAFTESLKGGFFVVEFSRNVRGQQGPGAYLLQAGSINEFVPDFH
jgi:predicted GNAT superfamily acetyltransferase